MKYSLFSLVAPGRVRPRALARAMARPGAEGRLRRRDRRRGRARACDRLLSRERARHHECRGAGEGLARRRQHRAQHHDHPLELSVGRKRRDLRSRAQAVGRAVAGAQLQRDVLAARRADARAHRSRRPGVQAACSCQSPQRRRQRVADARAMQGVLSAAEYRARHALSGARRRAAAARRCRASRCGRVGLCARRRPPRRRHHPELRGDGDPPRSLPARSPRVETTRGEIRARKSRRGRGRPHQRDHGAWPACACRSKASRCRRSSPSR